MINGKSSERISVDATSYVVVDIETTGMNHFYDEITQIGAIKYSEGRETGRLNIFLKTEVEIPPKVEKLTGISNDFLKMFGIEPLDAIKQFRSFVGDEIVVGHNFTTFDSKFLEDIYVRLLNCHFPNDYIDTLYVAKRKLPNLSHHSLEALSEEYGIDYTKAHNAIEDCEINHFVYEYLTFGYLLDSIGEKDKSVVQVAAPNKEIEDCLVETDLTEGWKAELCSMFPKLEHELGLVAHSLSVMASIGKDGNVTSYAICVYEPDIVEDRRNNSRNTVLARIKEGVLKSNPNIVSVDSKSIRMEQFGSVTEISGRYTIRLEKDSDVLLKCLVDCIRYGIENYISKASDFACCARYAECSKSNKCIHPNLLFAKACRYRKNLESGKIFY